MDITAPGSASRRLFFLGFLILFLELVLIRYLAGNIWNLGYFPNLVLLGVFIGMGTGFIFHERFSDERSRVLHFGSAHLLLALSLFVIFLHPPIPGLGLSGGEIGGDLYFSVAHGYRHFLNHAMFLVWFFSVIAIFFLIAQATAKVFRTLPPLKAYTLDIAGSCCGILTFMAISWFQVPSYLWFIFLIPIFLLGFGNGFTRQKAWAGASILVIALLAKYQDTKLLATYFTDKKYDGEVSVTWSPYQKVEYFNVSWNPHRIHVNGLGHQQMEAAGTLRTSWYQSPYQQRKERNLPPIKSVLVIGAGSGNDIAAALLNGAEHVDAVEIDPVIAHFGMLHHPEHPYADPRVKLTIDDGRAFMVRAKRKYDLIIFALTDSLVKVSPMAQLRLENYLFTEQSVKRAFELLEPNGDLVLYNFYRKDWLIDKIERMLFNATARVPRRLVQMRDFVVFNINSSDAAGTMTEQQRLANSPEDDWPFLYLKERGIPGVYIAGILCVLALLGFLLKRFSRDGAEKAPLPTKLGFMLMGVAFLLLETKSIIQFSLLFGTTWLNNSLVFLGVLLSVLLANWIALAFKERHLKFVYVALIAASLVTYFYPLGNLLRIDDTFTRFLVASAMTFSPIFFANLIFSVLFRKQKVAEHVFGWNLLGATLGGVAEYSSMVIGYNALALVVAACYALVFFLFWLDLRKEQPA